MFMKSTSFGVEVEFNSITRQRAAEVVREALGGAMETDTSGHTNRYKVIDLSRRVWRLTYDGSISGPDNEACELITPILSGNEDVETLQKVVRALRKAGAKTDNTCGIHVHVSHRDMDAKALRRLVIQWSNKEACLYHALNVSPYREDNYCKKTYKPFIEQIKALRNPTFDALAIQWYNNYGNYGSNYQSVVNYHYHESRYHSLNLHSFFANHNVEFRCFNGTLHAGKIKAYVQFCCATVAHAVESKAATISSMPVKKANWADWFVRIGLVGDEYKTCRQHMLGQFNAA